MCGLRCIVVVVGLAGCYSPSATVGAPCPDGICPAGQICDAEAPGGPACVLPGAIVDAGKIKNPDDGDDEPLVDASIGADASPPEDAAMLLRPANDLPADAIEIGAVTMFTWDPTNATDDYAAACASASGPDVFFTLTLTAPEVIYLDTFGSSADSVIAIHAGSCTQLGAAEACVDNSCNGLQSQGAWNLSAGTHCIIVDQVGMNGGTSAKLRVTRGNRTGDPLAGEAGSVTGNTCADDDSNNAGCGGEPAKDHHYFFTVCPNVSPNVHLETCNAASWDTVLQIRNAATGSSLGCNDDACGLRSILDRTVTGPGLFWAIIDGYRDCGAYTLKYTIQ